MIDTHCHLTFDGLFDRADAVIADAHAAGVSHMISVGTTPADTRRALTIAERYDNIYVTAGVHPGYVDQDIDLSELPALLDHPKVVALGEMGLDFHYPDPPVQKQRQVFEQQLALMHTLPGRGAGVIHNRKAAEQTLGMLRGCGIEGNRFVFHCFTGSKQELTTILDSGAMVSFTGVVTFKNAADLAEASDFVPLDRLMVETDSPYLTPAPHRKVKVNEPKYVMDVAAFLAQRRNLSIEDFEAATDANAQRFFNL